MLPAVRPAGSESKRALLELLIELRRDGKQVVGYGAPGKGNTLLNFCGIRTDFLDYTVDRNPYKHGRFTPGTHIPIHPPERLAQTRPDAIVILPWNLAPEISAQLAYTAAWGEADRAGADRDVRRAWINHKAEQPASTVSSCSTDATRERPDDHVGPKPVKVVIFCGGLGVRMGEATQRTPKPMIEIGAARFSGIMRYYAEWGYNDFILCLGYRGEVVKVLPPPTTRRCSTTSCSSGTAARRSSSFTRDVGDWRVTFVDTGADSTIGERLKVVGPAP